MAGRFIIRVDFPEGGWIYLTRDYSPHFEKFFHKRSMWTEVSEPERATRFWNRDAAEAAALFLAASEYKDYYVSVREWDGNREKNP